MIVDYLTEYIGFPNCVHYWVWSRIKFEDVVQSVLNMSLSGVCSLILT